MSLLSDEGAVAVVAGVAAAVTAALAAAAGDPAVAIASAALVALAALALAARDALGTPPGARGHWLVVALAVPGVAASLFARRWVTAVLLVLVALLHAGRATGYRVDAEREADGA